MAADPDTKHGETNGARTRFRVLVNEEWKDRNEQTQKHYEGQGGKKRWVTAVIAETVQFLDQAGAEDKDARPVAAHPQPDEPDTAF